MGNSLVISAWLLVISIIGSILILRWVGEERSKFLFIEAFIVGLFGGDALHAHVLHDRVVERLVADLFADLNHTRNLVSFAFAHKVRDGGGEDEGDFR